LKLRKLYHAYFLRQILDQQIVHVVNGQGTFQISPMITEAIMEAVKVDPSAVTGRIGLTTDNTDELDFYGKSI